VILNSTFMRIIRFMFVSIAVLGMAVPAVAASNSADAQHVHVQLVFPDRDLHPGDANRAGLYFKLEPGWHVYWSNAGDSGEPPNLKWTLPAGITAGPLQFPAPKRLPLGPLMDFGYEDEVLFPVALDIANTAKPGLVTLSAKAEWLVCREVCIPENAELSVQQAVPPSEAEVIENVADRDIYNRLIGQLPKSLPSADTADFQPTPNGFRLAVSTGRRETEAAFFPEDQDILDNPAPQKITPTAAGFILDLKKDPNLTAGVAQLKGVLELSGGRNYRIAARRSFVANLAPSGSVANPAPSAPSGASAMRIEITPGGLSKAPPPAFSIAVLASTVLFAFLGGLLLNLMPCVFPVLFLKGLALVNSGSEERHKLRVHGFVYTAGILVSFWTLVAALLALRAAGATLGWGFQFQSPVFLSLIAALLFFLGLSLAGQFEIGLTLTSAGGSLAAKQGYAGSFFTGVLAVIVATPCTAPFMGVAIGYALAQPAAVTFAVFTALALGLAAPYVALTLQPAWTRLLPKPGAWMDVLKQAVSVPIFATVIWLAWVLAQAYGAGALALLLSSFLLLAIAGWFLGRWPAQRWTTLVAGVVVLAVAGLSIFGAKRFAVTQATSAHAEPQGQWQPWSVDAVQHSLAANQPVFVDFTASWCLSCQVNERVALDQPSVQSAFASARVALYRADWTRQDAAITQALTALGRSGVPVYALYTPGQTSPQLLPQVLTPGIVEEALTKLPHTETQASAGTSKEQ